MTPWSSETILTYYISPGHEEAFHRLGDALAVLENVETRKEYDLLLANRRRAERARNREAKKMEEMEERRRQMKETLDRMERMHCGGKSEKQSESESEVVERLRREGAQLLEQEQEDVLIKFENLLISKKEKVDPILKVKWSKEKKAYTDVELKQVFFKYGALANIVMDKRKPTALVEFQNIESARMAFNNEKGLEENPLTVKALFDNTNSKEVFPKYIFEGASANPVEYLEQMEAIIVAKLEKDPCKE